MTDSNPFPKFWSSEQWMKDWLKDPLSFEESEEYFEKTGKCPLQEFFEQKFKEFAELCEQQAKKTEKKAFQNNPKLLISEQIKLESFADAFRLVKPTTKKAKK